METILINYAHNGFVKSQKANAESGLLNGADRVISYGVGDLDPEFIEKNQEILNQPRGAGYWLWKPYIILKTLNQVQEGDIVIYCDSGVLFISSIKPLIDLCVNKTKGVLAFHMEPLPENKEVLQTKKDTFVLMDCDTPHYQNSWPRLASYSIWQKNPFSLQLASEWLEYAQNPQIITDMPNQCGVDEDERYVAHRHDQSIFSLLTKKYNVDSYPDISQWGNGFRKNVPYDQIVNHHRSRS